jgi:hypothetical protein
MARTAGRWWGRSTRNGRVVDVVAAGDAGVGAGVTDDDAVLVMMLCGACSERIGAPVGATRPEMLARLNNIANSRSTH